MFRRCNQHGLTLVELIIAMTIMAMVVGTLGVLANGIQQSYEFAEGHGTATQHARVVLDRIARTVREATANEQFPGAIVVSETEGVWRFPEVLVVWRPDGDPVDPDGLPRFDELVIYCPDRSTPNRLVELTVPGDARVVPAADDVSQWQTEIDSIRAGGSFNSVTLTDHLRVCTVTEASGNSPPQRGAVRFEIRLRPSDVEWQDYQDGNLTWEDLAWVQGIYGSQTGLRQVWVRTELQLMPATEIIAGNDATRQPLAFFSSETIFYELHR